MGRYGELRPRLEAPSSRVKTQKLGPVSLTLFSGAMLLYARVLLPGMMNVSDQVGLSLTFW